MMLILNYLELIIVYNTLFAFNFRYSCLYIIRIMKNLINQEQTTFIWQITIKLHVYPAKLQLFVCLLCVGKLHLRSLFYNFGFTVRMEKGNAWVIKMYKETPLQLKITNHIKQSQVTTTKRCFLRPGHVVEIVTLEMFLRPLVIIKVYLSN